MSTDTSHRPGWVDDTVAEALGRRHRYDVVTPRTGGPAGNATLTAWLGVILLVTLAAESLTLFDVTGLLPWHAGLGVVIGALVLAKTVTTGHRVVAYYRGRPAYRAAGAPPTPLRVLGPLVVASGLAAVASGVTLVAVGRRRAHHVLLDALGQRVDAVTLHQLAVIAFATCVGLHLVARLVPALARLTSRSAPVPGQAARGVARVAVGALAAVGLAVVLPLVARW